MVSQSPEDTPTTESAAEDVLEFPESEVGLPYEDFTTDEAPTEAGPDDLDSDGDVSFIEDARARLGVLDAYLEARSKEGGIVGRAAEKAHRITDALDND